MGCIRILQIIGSLNSGGMESVVMNYYRNIDHSQVQFDFMVFSGRSFYDDEVERLGGKIFRITPKRKSIIRNSRELDEFFKNHPEYKIVHIHQGILNLAPLKKAAKYGVPIRIVHTHGINGLQLKYLRLYNELYVKPTVSRLTTHRFVCSPTIAGDIFSNEIVSQKKYVYIKNAIALDQFTYSETVRQKLRKELNIENNLVFGHVGRFAFQKNHKFLIDIFSEIHKRDNRAVLMLIGKGVLLEQLKNKVEEMNLGSAVRFMGVRSDVNCLMQAMDMFLMPSFFEGLPVVGVEAQAAGLPCFFSDNVPFETKITTLARFINLEKSPSFWAEQILSGAEYMRKDMTHEIRAAGFDIKIQAKMLEKFYLDEIEKIKAI